jgi:hypothetical protein
VYVGLCRVLALVVSCQRRGADKDIELVASATRCVFWSASSIAEPGTTPSTVPFWPPSAGSFPGNDGELSLSRLGRCSAGTEKPDGGSRERGGDGEARVAQP